MANAGLVLDVSPNVDGDWVMHLTGSHNGDSLTFYDSLLNTVYWNQDQGGAGGSYTTDSIEAFFISGLVNSTIADVFDVGDGTVVGDTQLAGFYVASDGLILKLRPDFGTSMSDFTATTFDQTVVLKPQDKNSYATVWNPGTYSDGDFTVNVSAIPEPATLGLAGLFAGGILFVRRTFMI